MAKASRVIVLVEDERHKNFVYRYLRQRNYSHHDIVVEDLPSGRGCGEQWVRERYAENVGAYRYRAARAETALIVVIDADNGDVNRRNTQLRNALDQANLQPRDNDERIAHLIPKRNIETWILCLTGTNVNELTDYRNTSNIDGLVKPAAVKLFEWSRDNALLPNNCVPSLKTGVAEIRKLE